jgi:hypothetical protein
VAGGSDSRGHRKGQLRGLGSRQPLRALRTKEPRT